MYDGALQIVVRFNGDETPLAVDISPQTTVMELSGRVSGKCGWCLSRTLLVFNGRILKSQDPTPLSSFGVKSGDTLYAVLRGNSVGDSGTPAPIIGCDNNPNTNGTSPRQLVCGTLSYQLDGAEERVDPVSVCKAIASHLENSNGTKNADLGWEKGLSHTRNLLNMPPLASPHEELAQTLSQTCSSLADIKRDLEKLADSISKTTIGSSQWGDVQEASTKIAPMCQKTAVLLGMVGCSLSNFSGSSNSSFVSTTPNGVIAVQTSRGRAVPTNRSPLSSIPVQMCRGIDSSPLCVGDAIGSLKLHDHCVLCYPTPQLGLAVAAEIILRALSNETAVLVLRSQKQIDETMGVLSRMGVNTKLLLDTHQISAVPNDCYVTPDMVAATATQKEQWGYNICNTALRESGKSHLHTIGEVSYVDVDPSSTNYYYGELVEYERRISESVYGSLPMRGCCFYDRSRFPPHVIDRIEKAHPIKISA
ncbi:hypothetical protein Pelo_11478 [Pelomyxa schiedti]|nr:hypothetical protein Pelo_11478 [Pelomyxa schiedti]